MQIITVYVEMSTMEYIMIYFLLLLNIVHILYSYVCLNISSL